MKRRIQHPDFLNWLRRNTEAGSVVLDVGCGNKWYWPYIDAKFIGVDAWLPFKPDYYYDLVIEDLPKVEAGVVYMLDVLEHFEKERALVLLEQAKIIARHSVIVLTPLVFTNNLHIPKDPESDYYNNPYEEHKCCLQPSDFEGFKRDTSVFYHGQYFHGVWYK